MRRLFAALAAAALLPTVSRGGTASTTEPLPQRTTLTFTSDPGDPVGRGGFFAVADPAGYFTAFIDRYTPHTSPRAVPRNYLYLLAVTPDGVAYTVNFIPPGGAALRNGTFDGLPKFDADPETGAGFMFARHDAQCVRSTAHVVISDLQLSPDSSTVQQVRVRWDQRCEATAPAGVRGDWTFVGGM